MPMAAANDEFRKALNLLMHDIRAPLSVASGYLRLIREDRLSSIDDRERALVGALEAIRRISRLCEEASDFGSVYDSPDQPTMLVGADDLTARVCAALQAD